MKLLLFCLLTVLFLSIPAHTQDDPGGAPNGSSGVENDTCWKNNSGNEVHVSVTGTVHSDQNIVVTEGDNSGNGKGTPDPDGGCAESSAMTVGSEEYQIKGSVMKWKNGSGDWIEMKERKCKEDGIGTDSTLAPDGTIGSLPDSNPSIVWIDSSGFISTLPA